MSELQAIRELRCNALWCLVTTFRALQDPEVATKFQESITRPMLETVERIFNSISDNVASNGDEIENIALVSDILSKGALYLFTTAAIKEIPPTLPSYLSSLRASSSSQSHSVLLRWLHNSFILTFSNSGEMTTMTERLSRLPLDVEAHNEIIRALCRHHCSTLVRVEDAQAHLQQLGVRDEEMYTVEDMVLCWIRGVLNCHDHYRSLSSKIADLYVDCADGRVLCMVLFAYYPDIMMEQQIAFQSNLTTEQRVQNWFAILVALHKIGIGVTFTAYDVVYSGFDELQLHFLSTMIELLSTVVRSAHVITDQGDSGLHHSIPESLEKLSLSRSLENCTELEPIREDIFAPESPVQYNLHRTLDENVNIASPSSTVVGNQMGGGPELCLVGQKLSLHPTTQDEPIEPSLEADRTFVPFDPVPRPVEMMIPRSAAPTQLPPVEPRRLEDERSSCTSSLLRSFQHDNDLQPISRVGSARPSVKNSVQKVEPTGENLLELANAWQAKGTVRHLGVMLGAFGIEIKSEDKEQPESVMSEPIPLPPPSEGVVEMVEFQTTKALAQSVKTKTKRRELLVQGSIDTDGIQKIMKNLDGTRVSATELPKEEALKKLQRENFALKAALMACQRPRRDIHRAPPPQQQRTEAVVQQSIGVATSLASRWENNGAQERESVANTEIEQPSVVESSRTQSPPPEKSIPKPLQAIQRRDSQRKQEIQGAGQATTRSNITLIRNALKYVCLPGEVNKAQLNNALTVLDSIEQTDPNGYFMILLKSDSLLFKALYQTQGTVVLHRCYGSGPVEINLGTPQYNPVNVT
eukprot:PhF_6_TR2274/c0_g1_i2/m.3940